MAIAATLLAWLILAFSAVHVQAMQLSGVKSWLLLLNNDLKPEIVARIAGSDHDMVVVDYLPSQQHLTAYPMAQTIAQLKRKPDGARRLVIAYLNIGQAEDYRTYWRKDWKIGNPVWILSSDPDGWDGNFPVAYWRKGWQDIVAGEQGLLSAIIAAGFDGIYMDWIGGFEDEAVKAVAAREGVDPAAAMIDWVAQIRASAHAVNPEFYLIGQNATPLFSNPRYLDALDGVAHESIWFTWAGGDKGPKGDCSVPRTESEIGSPSFLAQMLQACRREFDLDQGNAMHFVGEAEIVPALRRAQSAGKVVFTVDYALVPANAATVAKRSRALGFRPFVGAKDLKNYERPAP
jgi:cysteinyl-tRNA synthetase